MTISKFCDMWANGIASGEGHPYKRWQSCRVYVDGRTIYSYGSHFPMAYIIAPNVVWLNGDTFSVSTARHQRNLRDTLSRKADVTVIIVPRSALDAARADYRTLEPVDVKPERWEYTLHTSDVAPHGMSTQRTEIGRHWSNDTGSYVTGPFAIRVDYGAYLRRQGGDMESMPNAVGWVQTESGKQAVKLINGQYRWHTARHWLGDSVFKSSDGRYFVSSFDRQERRPLYFLSQLPGPVDTVEQAIESLSPESVVTAREMGRNVVRQGDMFAIATNVTTRQLKAQGATVQRRKVTVEWTWQAQRDLAIKHALEQVHGTMPDYPARKYINDFPGNGTMYDHPAFDAWYKQYRADCDAWADTLVAKFHAEFPELPEISRYGWQSALKYQPSRRWHSTRDVNAGALYGTAHTATEIATLPDGRQFARGVMYHDPAAIGETRAADHRRQPLGKQWHLIARNTVPVNGTGTGRRAG